MVAHSLPCNGTSSSYACSVLLVQVPSAARCFGSVSPRKKPRSRRCSVTKHSGAPPIFPERRPSWRVGQRETKLVLSDFKLPPRIIPSKLPPPNGPAETKAERKQIPKFGCFAFLVGRAEANLHNEFLEGGSQASVPAPRKSMGKVVCEKNGLLLISVIDRWPVNHRSPARAVVACLLSNSESIRERRARRGFAPSRRKSSQNSGRSRDQNILRENIFVWTHISLASRANIRILHNANSRQTRKKEREGRSMEDATIN